MQTVGNWQHLRVQTIGSFFCFAVTTLCIFSRDWLSVGLAGFIINSSIVLNFYLGGWVFLVSEAEARLTSVERMEAFASIPPEAARHTDPPMRAEWPAAGAVSFEDVRMRYRPDLPLALGGISFEISGGQTFGVVGRTGAGKSSVAAVLFRITELCGGRIVLDGVDIKGVGLYDLRSRLGIIPQDPTLFFGTMRYNLYPFGSIQDSKIWEVLALVPSLKRQVDECPQGLDTMVSEGGLNLSVGTRQLFCLCRALLRRCKVLVLDEATASLDQQTDAIIQSAVRTHFKDSTVIVVAHRLHTIIDCDQVLVIDEGRAVEQGSPAALLANKDGEFHRLVEATGPVTSKELHALALGKGKGGDEGGDCASAVPVI